MNHDTSTPACTAIVRYRGTWGGPFLTALIREMLRERWVRKVMADFCRGQR